MEIPTTLKHKPVIVSENYENIDGRSAYHTDAKGLSLGLAQWNDRGRVDISAKVWRYTDEKWSRQSEELPLHRVLDLAILVCRAQLYFRDAYRFPKLYNEEDPQIDRVGLAQFTFYWMQREGLAQVDENGFCTLPASTKTSSCSGMLWPPMTRCWGSASGCWPRS